MSKIVFYFDTQSTYSYMGFEFMEKYQKLWNIPVDYRPFNLNEVMANARNSFSPYKLPFMFADLKRTASITKIPFRGTPKTYPYDSSVALKTLQYIKLHHPDKLASAMRSLWQMEYVECKAPDSKDHVKSALQSVVDSAVIDQAMNDQECQQFVEQNTNDLKRMKGFGAPTILVYKDSNSKPQIFFGSDRFEHIAILLEKEFLPMKQLFASPKI